MFHTSSDKPHVLVVDDDFSTREVVSLLLDGEGFRVTTADDGTAALEQLRQGQRPGLILLDLMMPRMDGWQFRQAQLRDARLADIPVIVCSASRRISRGTDGLRALAHLDKPVDPAELIALVQRCYPHVADSQEDEQPK